MPSWPTPKPVKTSDDAVTMLRADLQNERETVGRYRERIRQAEEAMGEFALSGNIARDHRPGQEHEIDSEFCLGHRRASRHQADRRQQRPERSKAVKRTSNNWPRELAFFRGGAGGGGGGPPPPPPAGRLFCP